MKANITLGGTTFVYDQASGKDLGVYSGPFVKQHRIRTTHPDCPLDVFFAPDAQSAAVASSHRMVSVELGRLAGPAADILTPYDVKLFDDGGNSIANVPQPQKHWWWAKWRWQSSPRPIVRTPATIVAPASKMMLPYDGSMLYGEKLPIPTTLSYKNPMDIAGLVIDEGATGGRNEIGPITEAQAMWLCGVAPPDGMLAQAEAAMSRAIHWIDEATGAPVDCYEKPITFGYGAGIPRTTFTRANPIYGNYVNVEAAHTPALGNVPFLATDDPTYLLELQCEAVCAILIGTWMRSHYKLKGIPEFGQTRRWAWGARDIFTAWAATPEVVPSWLLPKSFFAKAIADMLVIMNKFMSSPAAVHRRFHGNMETDKMGLWQCGYESLVYALGLTVGRDDLRPFYKWQIESITPFSNGKSGWPIVPVLNPIPYYVFLFTDVAGGPAERTLIEDTSLDAVTVTDYAALHARYMAVNGFTKDPGMPDAEYAQIWQAAMREGKRRAEAMGDTALAAEVQPCLDRAEQVMPAYMKLHTGALEARLSVAKPA